MFPLKPRAILIDVVSPNMDKATAERRLLELDALTKTYGGIVVVKLFQKRALPDYKTYIGSGKVDEIVKLAAAEKAELLIINNLLKPGQMFKLGELLRPHKMRVWDRVDLILKIFDKHAKTSEAKLQIKLAALRHMGPRIYGMGLEMMQQAGGTGTRGGQGETNTEIMKRHLAEQEKHTRKELDRLAVSRQGHRKRRDRIGLKTVSIIGYTNAGKSSLLNALTRKGAYVADALFATLDTRVGELVLKIDPLDRDARHPEQSEGSPRVPGRSFPSSNSVQDDAALSDASSFKFQASAKVLLSDTIGFIQDLPPQLIDAFRSTLDETVDADLLLHVIDVSDPYREQKIAEVEQILAQLGVADKPKVYAFNKTDLAGKKFGKGALQERYADFSPVFVSSKTSDGLEGLKREIAARLK